MLDSRIKLHRVRHVVLASLVLAACHSKEDIIGTWEGSDPINLTNDAGEDFMFSWR